MRKIRCLIAVCFLLLPALGCRSGPAVGTVHGEVNLDGQPLKKGVVRFVPVDGKSPTAGAIIADGRFTAEVPAGLMRVEINASRVIGQRRTYAAPDSPVEDVVEEIIPPQFNRESTLTLTVEKGAQSVRYDVTSR